MYLRKDKNNAQKISFMAHELLIEVECISSDDKYTELLKKLEIPRGLTVSIIYSITNKSNTKFSALFT